jgi:hypothetical protein
MGQISTIGALSNLKSVPPLAQPSHLCKAEMAQYLMYFYSASRRFVFSDSLRMPPPVVSFSATQLRLRRGATFDESTPQSTLHMTTGSSQAASRLLQLSDIQSQV